ncbi:MAG: putative metalloprotease CJM1_0395 family protein [Thermodesulfobacteriota bacterium]
MQGIPSLNSFLRPSAAAHAGSHMGSGMGQGVLRSTPNQAPVAPPSAVGAQDASPSPTATAASQPGKPTNASESSSASKDTVHLSKQAQEANQDTANAGAPEEMSRAERQVLQQLRDRDREVKSHEQAHIAAGGQYVNGGANYSYRLGPDGTMYAVGGEVSIEVSPVPGDPEATIEKAQAIQRAANAPAEPSAQDMAVAAKARAMETEARIELRQQKDENGQAVETKPDGDSLRVAGANASDSDEPAPEKTVASMQSQRETAASEENPTRNQAFGQSDLLQAAHAYTAMAVPPTAPSATPELSLHA